MKNINIDHKIIAKHFVNMFSDYKSARTALLKLKNKWQSDKKGSWVLYVKAYNWDTMRESNDSKWTH